MNNQKLLPYLSDPSIKLSKSDKLISKVIISDPQSVIHQSISTLAKRADVSEPTVNRFCRKLGCKGYPDFKLRLAQEISSSQPLFTENIDTSDNASAVMKKIIESVITSVQSITETTNTKTVEEVAAIIAKSKSVSFFGVGASGPVALDAQQKFIRFGIPVVAETDFINQRLISSLLSTEDVAIFISYTGRTRAIIESAQIAKEAGAVVIGITHQDSPLCEHCHHILNAVLAENTDLFTPTTSRIIHLTIIDILATTVALNLGSDIKDKIMSLKTKLIATRIDP